MRRPHSLLATGAVALVVATVTAGALVPGPWSSSGHTAAPAGQGAGDRPVTYYISPGGSDAAAGTSPDTAWRSLHRASAAVLAPGDRVLLAGGATFAGQLRLGPADAGDAARPVTVGSFGNGRATITGSDGSGIVVMNTAGVDIADLNIHASAPPDLGGAGISLFSDLPGAGRLAHVSIAGVDVSGFAAGIAVGASGLAGFRDIRIQNAVLHDNLTAGLASYGPPFRSAAPAYAHENLQVSRVTAYHNRGDAADTSRNTGSGIVVGSVSGARVGWSAAYGNGGLGASPAEGPIGIWAYDSTRVVIERSLSHGNRSATSHDGGGFGLDQNTSRSYLQYNLSYDNDGAGFLLYTHDRNAAHTGNVVRFNTSAGDSRKAGNLGSVTVGGAVRDSVLYQNTVVAGDRAAGDRAAGGRAAGGRAAGPNPVLWVGSEVRGVTVRDNTFTAAPGEPVVLVAGGLPRAALTLTGNDYGPAGVRMEPAGTWPAATGS